MTHIEYVLLCDLRENEFKRLHADIQSAAESKKLKEEEIP